MCLNLAFMKSLLSFQKNIQALALVILFSPATYAQSSTPIKYDSLKSESVKSYFLLKVNLDTEPSDLQNYLSKVQFKIKGVVSNFINLCFYPIVVRDMYL